MFYNTTEPPAPELVALINNINGTSKQQLNRKLTLLSPYSHLSLRQLKNLGFHIGKKLHRSLRQFNPWEPYVDGRRRSGQVGYRNFAAEIEDAWQKQGETIGSTDNRRIVVDTKQQAYSKIRALLHPFQPSDRTLARRKPANVSFTGRDTDKCPRCYEYAHFMAKGSRDAKENPILDSMVVVDEQGATVAPSAHIKVLKRHVDLATSRRAEYSAACDVATKHTPDDKSEYPIIVAMDWASPTVVSSVEGTSHEYFNASRYVHMLGGHLMCRGISEKGHFYHAYTHAKKLVKEGITTSVAAVGVIKAMLEDLSQGGNCPKSNAHIMIWTDNATHFKNKVFIHEVAERLLESYAFISKVSTNYHVEYHGKTALDGSFSHGKAWISRKIDRFKQLTDSTSEKFDLASVISDAYYGSTLPGSNIRAKYRVLNLADPQAGDSGYTKLDIPDIRAMKSVTTTRNRGTDVEYWSTHSVHIPASKCRTRELRDTPFDVTEKLDFIAEKERVSAFLNARHLQTAGPGNSNQAEDNKRTWKRFHKELEAPAKAQRLHPQVARPDAPDASQGSKSSKNAPGPPSPPSFKRLKRSCHETTEGSHASKPRKK